MISGDVKNPAKVVITFMRTSRIAAKIIFTKFPQGCCQFEVALLVSVVARDAVTGKWFSIKNGGIMEQRIKEHLCSMYGMAYDDVSELFAIGKKSVCETLNRLDIAIRMKNVIDIAEIAHMLKGTLYNMGLSEIGDIAKQIEMEAKRGKSENATQHLKVICIALGDVLRTDN